MSNYIKLAEKYPVIKVDENNNVSLNKKIAQEMDALDLSRVALQLAVLNLKKTNERIKELEERNEEFSSYTFRFNVLEALMDKIDKNISYMESQWFFEEFDFDGEKEMLKKQAKKLRTEGNASARLYNLMLKELESENSLAAEGLSKEARQVEYVKLKYEKTLGLLTYRMLEFDIWNTPAKHWCRAEGGRFFVAHNYFGGIDEGPDEADVDHLSELRIRQHETDAGLYVQPKPKRTKEEEEKYQWEQEVIEEADREMEKQKQERLAKQSR